MKRFIISLAILVFSIPVFSQGWVFISGTITDTDNGFPVAGQPVTIYSDSTSGLFYYNVVFTDSSGYYFDEIPAMSDTTGILYVQVTDCNGIVTVATIIFDPVNSTFTQDFTICTMSAPCEAYFYYSLLDNMVIQFTDFSAGNPYSWYWDFGDNTFSSEQNPVHQYNSSGWFTVTLSISNQSTNCYDSYSEEIYVYDSISPGCSSSFYYLPDPAGSPDAFQFMDASLGNIIRWLWDFGDGSISEEQFPFHQFPGPGTYEVCLAVEGVDCADTSCQVITISDTVYQQVYGQVFAGNFPLQAGKVMIYAQTPNGAYTPLDEGCPVDSNGIYFFTLVPEGTYLIQAIPADSIAFLPTYYRDAATWQNALQVVIGQPENPYNINLVQVPIGTEYYGPGSLTGQINNLGMERSMTENVIILLLDQNLVNIGFSRVGNDGRFVFPSLDYGTYHIRADLAGVGSENLKFEISPEIPDVEVVLNYTGNSVLGTDEPNDASTVLVYPIPAKDRLYIDVNLNVETTLSIVLYSISGACVYRDFQSSSQPGKTIIIPLDRLTAGIYFLELTDGNGLRIDKKVVISW